MTIGIEDIRAAARRIAGVAVRTPLLTSPDLDARVGAPVFLKPECLQRTGSFKMRGAYNRIASIPEADRGRGVVAFSSGNHAQGVAEAARLLGVAATIVMPADAPVAKIEGARRRGATIRLYDRLNEDREAIAREIAGASGATVVAPYDDPLVMAGQATCGLEAIEDAAAMGVRFGTALCNASGGGLMAGVALAFEALSPATRLVVCEPAEHDDHRRSLAQGTRVRNAPGFRSICDALMAETPGALTFPVNQRLLAQACAATDDEVMDAMTLAFDTLKLVVEPGGAVALACLLSGKVELEPGAPVLCILSGGNVDASLFARAITRRNAG